MEEDSVDLVKLLNAPGLTVESLHHNLPAIHFFNVTVDMAQVILLAFEEDLRLTDDQTKDAKRQRDDGHSHQGHLPADGEHHHDHTDDRSHGCNDLRQTLVKGLADRVHILGDAGEHLAMARAFKRY